MKNSKQVNKEKACGCCVSMRAGELLEESWRICRGFVNVLCQSSRLKLGSFKNMFCLEGFVIGSYGVLLGLSENKGCVSFRVFMIRHWLFQLLK